MEPVPTVSNYCVLPVVAIVELTGALNLNPDEVEDIIYIPVNWLKRKKTGESRIYTSLPEDQNRLSIMKISTVSTFGG